MKHIWAVAEIEDIFGRWEPFAFFTNAQDAEKYRADMIADERATVDSLRVIRIELNPTWSN
jgi:hypothetical protein